MKMPFVVVACALSSSLLLPTMVVAYGPMAYSSMAQRAQAEPHRHIQAALREMKTLMARNESAGGAVRREVGQDCSSKRTAALVEVVGLYETQVCVNLFEPPDGCETTQSFMSKTCSNPLAPTCIKLVKEWYTRIDKEGCLKDTLTDSSGNCSSGEAFFDHPTEPLNDRCAKKCASATDCCTDEICHSPTTGGDSVCIHPSLVEGPHSGAGAEHTLKSVLISLDNRCVKNEKNEYCAAVDTDAVLSTTTTGSLSCTDWNAKAGCCGRLDIDVISATKMNAITQTLYDKYSRCSPAPCAGARTSPAKVPSAFSATTIMAFVVVALLA
ncbi:hypothetical protein RI054_17g79090 [Pseudoscourfieldia marina]